MVFITLCLHFVYEVPSQSSNAGAVVLEGTLKYTKWAERPAPDDLQSRTRSPTVLRSQYGGQLNRCGHHDISHRAQRLHAAVADPIRPSLCPTRAARPTQSFSLHSITASR